MTMLLQALRATTLCLLLTATAQAQSVAGQAVESESGAPLPRLLVRLVRQGGDSAPHVAVDSTRTDARGLFEFPRVAQGIYQLEFGPADRPFSRGPIDTVRAAGPQRRRYAVPVPRMMAEGAAGQLIAAPGAASAAPASPRPRLVRVGVATLLGTALGGGAGFAVASVRCGRTPTCVPATSYPYLAAGAIMGTGIVGGIAGRIEGCRWGLARGIAGSLAGSLAGALLVRSDLHRSRAAASAGSVVGTIALVSTCRLHTPR